VLRGDYSIVMDSASMTNIETVTLLSGSDGRFVPAGALFNYTITTADNTVAAGATMTFNGGGLQAGETLHFDGSAETNGNFRLFGGADNDSLIAGAGNDLLYGGLGADYLKGGAGADTYTYKSAAESTGIHFDTIDGFDPTIDKIHVPVAVSGWDANVTHGALNGASFDADLAAAIDGTLDPNAALLFTPDSGDYAGKTFAVIDANGDGSYEAGQDYVIMIANPVAPIDHHPVFA
jgi:Ca2+-binding RTX toxin-like protein